MRSSKLAVCIWAAAESPGSDTAVVFPPTEDLASHAFLGYSNGTATDGQIVQGGGPPTLRLSQGNRAV